MNAGSFPGCPPVRSAWYVRDVLETHGIPRVDEVKAVVAYGSYSRFDVPSREEALEWAAKIAVACRCAQEVRELLPEPTV
jgi:hypothetical protein